MPIDVPFLLGLDIFLEHALTLDFKSNTIRGKDNHWAIPIHYNHGHAFILPRTSPLCTHFTKQDLMKLHKHFMHPSTGKLYNLLKRAFPTKVNDKIRQMLQDIAEKCDQCAEHAVPPFRFRASIPKDNIIFNRELSIDLMWLNGKPVLHVVDTETGFQNAIFIQDKTAENLWNDFINCWASVYTGFPEIIRLDRETSFTSTAFRENAEGVGVELQFSGIEAHNSIG